MYQVGDWIYYGNVGACQVTDVAVRKIAGMEQEHLYYTLRPLDDDCSISTPADTGKIFMRPIISKDEAEALIETIPSISADAYYNPVKQLSDHYEQTLNSHDCGALIKMTMSIYTKKKEVALQKRKLGAVDEKFMRRAEDLLFGELAVALGIKRSQVPSYIAAKVEKEA